MEMLAGDEIVPFDPGNLRSDRLPGPQSQHRQPRAMDP